MGPGNWWGILKKEKKRKKKKEETLVKGKPCYLSCISFPSSLHILIVSYDRSHRAIDEMRGGGGI